MKRLFFFVLLLFVFFLCEGQKKTRKEREELRMKEVQELIDSGEYVFTASHALPMSGTSIYLDAWYDLTITGDSACAYLPYYGVAYQADYGDREGGIKFEEPYRKYTVETTKSGKQISFEIKEGRELYKISLSVSEMGYATLFVTCLNRQPIRFYGTIQEIEPPR